MFIQILQYSALHVEMLLLVSQVSEKNQEKEEDMIFGGADGVITEVDWEKEKNLPHEGRW